METKACKKCGRELPVSQFYRASNAADGYQCNCKACRKAYLQARKQGISAATSPIKGSPDSPLGAYTPRELMDELKRRGYHGELRFLHTIKL